MQIDNTLRNQTKRITNEIVAVVERADGAVTLAQIERDVPGFCAHEPPAWERVITHGDREYIIWDRMTEAGSAALRELTYGRRLAVQVVDPLWYYFLENRIVTKENWLPIMLLPKKAANLDNGRWLMRVPPRAVDYMVAHAANDGCNFQKVRPGSVRFTADQFSI
jgi:hypothetical protein